MVKFNPGIVSEVPKAFVLTGDINEISFGGGYLWVREGEIKKINPSTYAVEKTYIGSDFDAFFNGKLWRVDDDRLYSYTAP